MKIKMTEVAKRELDQLAPQVRRDLLQHLRTELVGSVDTDATVHVGELGVDFRVHSSGPGLPVTVYRVFDTDRDGEDEAVVTMLVSEDELQVADYPSPIANGTFEVTAPSTRSARIGHELLTKLKALT